MPVERVVPNNICYDSKVERNIECNGNNLSSGNAIHQMILNVDNTTVLRMRENMAIIIKNKEGTHHDASFTKATSFNKAINNEWLKNPSELISRNRDIKSKEIGFEIRDMKKLISENEKKSKVKCNNNSEHIIPQSVLCPEFKEINTSASVLEFAKNARSYLVNNSLAYQENKKLHNNHAATRWLIQKNIKCDDTKLYETYNKEKGIYINADGDIFSVVNGGFGKPLDDILKHEDERNQYKETISYLLKNEGSVSSAIQMNVSEYANMNGFEESKIDINDKLTNKVADLSFYHMIGTGKNVVYANDDAPQNISENQHIVLNAIELDAIDKVEVIIARLTMSLRRYPMISEVKEVINSLKIDLPVSLESLKGNINDLDMVTPYYDYNK